MENYPQLTDNIIHQLFLDTTYVCTLICSLCFSKAAMSCSSLASYPSSAHHEPGYNASIINLTWNIDKKALVSLVPRLHIAFVASSTIVCRLKYIYAIGCLPIIQFLITYSMQNRGGRPRWFCHVNDVIRLGGGGGWRGGGGEVEGGWRGGVGGSPTERTTFVAFHVLSWTANSTFSASGLYTALRGRQYKKGPQDCLFAFPPSLS